jgi:hypothetical protein
LRVKASLFLENWRLIRASALRVFGSVYTAGKSELILR